MASIAAVAVTAILGVAGSSAPPSSAPTAAATLAATPTSIPPLTANADPQMPLADALAELERQNLTLAQARARADEAAALVGQARAALLPSLAAQGSYVRNSDEFRLGPLQLGPIVIDRTVQPKEAFSVTGSVRVPLAVPTAWYDAEAARSGARAAEASADAVRLQLRAGFAQAAHAAAAADEVVFASERAVESAAELARSADRRVRAGTAAPLDVLRARTEQVRRESDLARARADAERGRLALGILLGRDGPVRVQVPDAPGVEARDDAPALLEEALARRPDLAAQRAQVDAAHAAARSSRARLLPQLSASASAFAQDVPFPTGQREGWRASVDLTWAIFDGGFREARQRQAAAQGVSARAAAEAQRLAVVQEVSDGARDLAVARERLRLAETQRTLAGDAAASARRSFDAGIASSLDVIDANDRLYQADVGLAEARARLAQARVGLDRALGR
ncbi:MAG TPA: TolC family protein [Anaeromyxobacter sp.]